MIGWKTNSESYTAICYTDSRINRNEIRKVLVDVDSSINIMPLSTFISIGILLCILRGNSIEICRFRGEASSTIGLCQFRSSCWDHPWMRMFLHNRHKPFIPRPLTRPWIFRYSSTIYSSSMPCIKLARQTYQYQCLWYSKGMKHTLPRSRSLKN